MFLRTLRARRPDRGNRRGSSIVEFALLAPWYVFLFIGAFDFGFYSYALIATQNAARIVAMYCSASSSRAGSCSACTYAVNQFTYMPNMSGISTCTASPLVVTTSSVAGPVSGDTGAAQATVTYTTPTLIPIPGVLPGSVTISRTAVMRILS